MCGIAGFLDPAGRTAHPEAAVRAMAAKLRRRGPDDAGAWTDPGVGIALGHRRLAVIDRSAEGHQPMISRCGRYVACYNGEIYNFPALRRELERLDPTCAWRGHSDTEVLLEAVSAWGLPEALARCNGMFALALWDRDKRALHLARDRMGEKPLYYGWSGDVFLFGSEPAALAAHPTWDGEIDRGALALLLRHGCIPAPHSIYAGIAKLAPGTLLTLVPDRPGAAPDLRPFWRLENVVEAGLSRPFAGTADEAVETLDGLLAEAVRLRMVSDVPLGAFLSGGIDSSMVVALMQAHSDRPVKTFSIGSHDPIFDEAPQAREVARHLGTDHTELYVTERDALDVVPELPAVYGEPFADSSQIPTLLVSRLTRKSVTVALSGDGGDELFGGYNRHVWGPAVWRRGRRLPRAARGALARSLTLLSETAWDRAFRAAGPLLPGRARHRMPGHKLHKLARVLPEDSPGGLYRALVSAWSRPGDVVGADEPETPLTAPRRWRAPIGTAEQMMFLDAAWYLPDDILVKVDRAAMAVSLETRIPFLDPHVIGFAWSLPLALKIRDGRGKWVLRRVLDRYVPKPLVDRPKAGFGVPIGDWLRGPLRPWAEALLDPRRLASEAYLDPAPIRERWAQHLSGRRNWHDSLWSVLMFQAWLETRP